MPWKLSPTLPHIATGSSCSLRVAFVPFANKHSPSIHSKETYAPTSQTLSHPSLFISSIHPEDAALAADVDRNF
jgi:hypothetical protein